MAEADKGSKATGDKKARAKVDDRVKIGIKKLDEILQGGLLPGRAVAVVGGPGSGKTTLALEYLYRGASEFGEKGVFISLEEEPNMIIDNIKRSFNWDIDSLIKEGSFAVISVTKFDFETLIDIIQSHVMQKGFKRVVIDPITLMRLHFKDDFEYRRGIIDLISMLRKMGCSALLTSEVASFKREGIGFKEIENYASDGVIVMYNLALKQERQRAIEVLKMRGINHERSVMPFSITENGIRVYKEEII
jgi:circadian clock protein KaiC